MIRLFKNTTNLIIMLLVFGFFKEAQGQINSKDQKSEVGQFSDVKGTLIAKEFIPIGSLNKEISFEIMEVKDLISSKKASGVKIKYESKYSDDAKGNLLDKDEIDNLLLSIKIIQEKVIVSRPINYKEVIFSSRSGLQYGCFWNKGKWTVFLQVDKSDSRSYGFLMDTELGKFSDLLKSAKEKL